MKVVIVGAGEVGWHLTKFLTKEAHRVTLIDRDPRKVRRVAASLDVQTVEGHAGDAHILQKAGVRGAELLVAVTDNEELNMLASLIAKRLGTHKTVVRVKSGVHLLDQQFFYKDTLGFDLTISPEEMASLEIVRICRGQNALPVENFAGGRLQMRRLEILSSSPACGRTIAELRLPARVLVTATVRGKDVTVPRGDHRVEQGDFMVFIGVPDALDKAEKVVGGRPTMPRRVLIVGSGPTALMVARNLAPHGTSVRLIAPDEESAEAVSQELAGAEVIVGAGTDLDLLKEEGIARTDVFISLDDGDEVNLLACQLARSLGASRTVALVNRQDYASLVDQLGIDHAVSPRRLVAKRIAGFVRGEGQASITTIHRGAAEVMDQVVDSRFPYAGKQLFEVPFPVGSIVGGIIRGESVHVPTGDTRIEEGDHLLIFALTAVVESVESLFRGKPSESPEARVSE